MSIRDGSGVTPRGGDPTDSATENTPPSLLGKVEKVR